MAPISLVPLLSLALVLRLLLLLGTLARGGRELRGVDVRGGDANDAVVVVGDGDKLKVR